MVTLMTRNNSFVLHTLGFYLSVCSYLIIADHQEGLQILHYHDGQKYEPHFDYFHDAVNARPENGGQRVITVLMYL